jgi:hypothetical protein
MSKLHHVEETTRTPPTHTPPTHTCRRNGLLVSTEGSTVLLPSLIEVGRLHVDERPIDHPTGRRRERRRIWSPRGYAGGS